MTYGGASDQGLCSAKSDARDFFILTEPTSALSYARAHLVKLQVFVTSHEL